jgi:hypothetical protein
VRLLAYPGGGSSDGAVSVLKHAQRGRTLVTMSAIRGLLCKVRGGHRWETTEDPFGGTTICSSCGKLRHAGGGTAPDIGGADGDYAAEKRVTTAAREKES